MIRISAEADYLGIVVVRYYVLFPYHQSNRRGGSLSPMLSE